MAATGPTTATKRKWSECVAITWVTLSISILMAALKMRPQAQTVQLQQCAAENEQCHVEINHQSGYIDQRGNERGGGGRRVETTTTHQDWQHRADHKHGRLRAGVAAARNDQLQKHRKNRRPFDFTVVTLHRGGGQHFPEK